MTWILLQEIILGLVGYGLLCAFILLLFRMSGDQDRQARHTEKALIPFSDVTITQYGTSWTPQDARHLARAAST